MHPLPAIAEEDTSHPHYFVTSGIALAGKKHGSEYVKFAPDT